MYTCRYIARCTLVPFTKKLQYNLEAVREVAQLKPQLISAVGELLKLGHRLQSLDPSYLAGTKAAVLSATAGTIDERQSVGYALLLWITQEVRIYTLISYKCSPLMQIPYILSLTGRQRSGYGY